MDDIFIIIPSYKPDKEIMWQFLKLLKQRFKKIIVVNDGSGEEYNDFFNQIENKEKIVVLKHYLNFGKGRAIKTAFNYILNHKDNNTIGTITADCDGQHKVEDIVKCAEKLRKEPNKLIIGTRNFDESHVPIKSRYGNKLTRTIIKIFVGMSITDTQSGLRGFGIEVMKKVLLTKGERYEYETNMLIDCKENNIDILEIPISTVYINKNSLSHFNPIKDSMMIYKIFIKYIISSISSFVIDLLLFALLVKMIPEFKVWEITDIVIATIIARIISSLYNFFVNAKIVFKNQTKKSMIKYFILVIIQMFISAFVVSKLFELLKIDSTLIKLCVDTVIFVINFIIQREWIFTKK